MNTYAVRVHRMMQETVHITLLQSGKQGLVAYNSTASDAAHELGVEVESICGGRLTCGKCLISNAAGLSEPQAGERAFAEIHNIDLNTHRLACVARIIDDATLHIPEAHKQIISKGSGQIQVDIAPAVRVYYVEVEAAELGGAADLQRLKLALAEQWDIHDVDIDSIVLRSLQKHLRDGQNKLSVTIWQGKELVRIQPGYDESLYGLAIDVGSTTIAAHLCDLHTGEILTTETMMNPQIRYGEDIMSRISYCMENTQGLNRLHKAIIQAINDLATHATKKVNIPSDSITDCVIVGNTVMLDLLLGIDPVELGGAPFALATQDAVDIKARDLGLKALHDGAMIHILPSIAGHVGADNVGVLLSELSNIGTDNTIIVDVGTNAEILLATQDRILSTSSPTGPAFEGAQIQNGQRAAIGAIERVRITKDSVRYKVIGDERWNDEFPTDDPPQPTGICGSGIIEVVVEMFLNGIIDKSGLFVDACLHPNVNGSQFILADSVIITQNDVRAIQLAKAALYAGTKLLMDEAHVSSIDTIKLAGAFGSYIDPKYALILGLVPDCDSEQVTSIGNAAGDGALIALLNVEQRQLIQEAVKAVEYVETAAKADFQDLFVAALPLPHSVDDYPHIQHLLPANVSERTIPHRSRRKRKAQA